jgi:hypothetical protein
MIDEADLEAAVAAGFIADETRLKLIALARGRAASLARPPSASLAAPPRFDAVHALYYAGALIVIAAMGLFTNAAFNALGGWALASIAVAYAAGFAALGRALWRKPETRTPGGLAIAVAVSMTPLAVYGVQDALNLWSLADKPRQHRDFFPLMNASWVYMEVAALVALAVFLGRRIYAVVGAIGICVYLGYLASDVFKDALAFSFALSTIGLAVIFAGVWLQRRQRAISAFLDAALPPALRVLRPARASAA